MTDLKVNQKIDINNLILSYRQYINNIIIEFDTRDRCTARDRLCTVELTLMSISMFLTEPKFPTGGLIKLLVDKLNQLKIDVEGLKRLRLITDEQKTYIY